MMVLALFGCGAGGGGASLLVSFEREPAAPAPQYLLLTWVGEGKVFAKDRRLPATGTLSTNALALGTFEIELDKPGGSRTLVARGMSASGVTSEGVARAATSAGITRVALRMELGRMADGDGDGIPDAIDDCPADPDPGQGGCASDGGRATDGRTDAPTDTSADRGSADAGLAPAEMVLIAAGPFTRGCNPAADKTCATDERPARTITLAAFQIDRTEVTQEAYDRCVRAGACGAPAGFDPTARPKHPVLKATWAMGDGYCRWAGKRLPTEAEWEKAARGADQARLYPWGNDPPNCTRAQYRDCGFADAVPVSALSGASVYRVDDMAGNVAEWVGDYYAADYYTSAPATDPRGPATGTARVARGGGFTASAGGLRVTARAAATAAAADQGFRCAKD
jgi:formylglycine-generating enzyme